MRRMALWISVLVLLFGAPFMGRAQTPPPAPSGSSGSSDQLLKPEELEALVAPIALYPDSLLAQVLMASTYPLEVVQADRWAKENKNLKGDQLKAAVDKQGWDETVKALVATPSVLEMMSTKLDWTQKLGDAVLAQQPDVMDAVQRLRSKAEANGKLKSTKEQKVSTQKGQNKQVIVIEPTNPETVYVPYYNPSVVYGGWPYPTYPPYYFGYPGYIPGAVIGAGLAFGAGYALGRWASGGNYWGGNVNWNNNNININRPQVNPLGGNNFQHRPEHRQGVRYNNSGVQQKFGNNNLRNSSQSRGDFRGRGGNQVLQPGGGQNRPGGGAGRRPAAGQRPAGGQSRPSAGQRPAGGANRGQAARPSTQPGGGRGNAMGNIQSGRSANLQSQRGRASMSGGGAARMGGGGGGGARMGGGGGGRGGGGGGRGGGGGGRRSDVRLKHDIVLIGRLSDGLGFYRFAYNGSDKTYVGVLAQEVQSIEPTAVVTGQDGYLRVYYNKLGLKFQTYDEWRASGARVPPVAHVGH